MPYKSAAQRGYFHANRARLEAHGVNVSEWDNASKGMSLPHRVKKRAEGGEVENEWENIPRSPEGRPQIIVTKPQPEQAKTPYDVVSGYAKKARDWFGQPSEPQIKPNAPPPQGFQALPDQVVNDSIKGLASHYAGEIKELANPFTKTEEGKYVADQPLSADAHKGKIPQTQKDIVSLGAPIAGEVISNLAGPPGKGALWDIGKTIAEGSLAAAARRTPRVIPDLAAQARDKVLLGYMDSSTVSPRVMAQHLATANKGNPEDMADDLYRLWETDPKYGDEILRNIPRENRDKVDHFLDQRIRASDEGLRSTPDYEAAFHDLPVGREDYVPLDLPKEQTQWATTYKSILPASGISEEVGDFLSARVLPHYDSNFKAFTDKYFGGMYNPAKSEFRTVGRGGVGMRTELVDPSTGKPLMINHPMTGEPHPATMDRSIIYDPDTRLKYAYHGYFVLPKDKQGVGVAKSILRDQVDLYKKMDLDYVKLTADVDIGSYAWGKYGFLPHTDESWQSLARYLKMELSKLSSMGRMPGTVVNDLKTILSDPDRHALWDFVDYPSKIPIGILGSKTSKPLKWSQKLILDTPWEGSLNLKNPDAMRKFYDYANKGQ